MGKKRKTDRVQPPKIATLCWKCAKAIGGCSWTRIDEETGKVSFTPVKGWTATERVIKDTNSTMRGKLSYCVLDCPEYESDGREESKEEL